MSRNGDAEDVSAQQAAKDEAEIERLRELNKKWNQEESQ